MNRYQNWVGALHWGQLLLLVPTLLFAGVAAGVGAFAYGNNVEVAARSEVDAAETALREFREDPFADLIPKRQLEDPYANLIPRQQQEDPYAARSRPRRQQLYASLVRAVENAQYAETRLETRAAWVRRAGMLGLALAWLTAFLSLWWWFGAKAKPRESQ
jgi:hypothetical protein